MKRILIVGAAGQIGTELVPHLQKHYGYDNVVAADLRDEMVAKMSEMAITEKLDILDINAFEAVVKKYNIDAIFNMVALLSATGEKNPELAWKSIWEHFLTPLLWLKSTKQRCLPQVLSGLSERILHTTIPLRIL